MFVCRRQIKRFIHIDINYRCAMETSHHTHGRQMRVDIITADIDNIMLNCNQSWKTYTCLPPHASRLDRSR